jgi:O-antigen ligase
MEVSLTVVLAGSIAILFALFVVCTKPEYGLFCYGLALGFPDIAVPLGTAINIRVDDVLIVLFLLRSFLWIPSPLAWTQLKILRWQAILLAICALSAAIGLMTGAAPAAYESIKMVGCSVILFTLPRLLQSKRRLRFLITGLMCGGVALVMQVINRLSGSSLSGFANFQQFKNAATFSTWNPNTIGQAGMLLVFAAGLGWIIFGKNRISAIVWLGLAIGFALVPLSVFARGTSLSIAAGIILYFCLTRRWKLVLPFVAICLGTVVYLHSVNKTLVENAAQVDLTTGEGFSHRFERWNMAAKAIVAAPLTGHGFGQEWILLDSIGSDGRAHNAYMTVWIEVGIGGLAILLAFVYQFASAVFQLFRQPEFEQYGALLLALIAALCLDSSGLPTLYWEKLPTIALSIGISLIGICRQNCQESVGEVIPQRRSLEMLGQRS